jgi:hypothetical protein
MSKKENALKISPMTRLKYTFSGYKTQIFIESIRKKAPKYILAILILLTVIYILLHPIDKIKLRHFITRSVTIETVSNKRPLNNSYFVGPIVSESEIHIDGDWIETDGKYYNLVNGEVYRYFKDSSGKWQKELYEIDIHSTTYAELLDKSNYERDKKNPFIWKLKEEACKEILGMDNARIKRYHGSIAIVSESTRNTYTAEKFICFWGFGTTNVELPWED